MNGSTLPRLTDSVRLDVVAQTLSAVSDRLGDIEDVAVRRALLARLHACVLAMERWMLSEERSEAERAATFRDVLELHVDVLAAAGTARTRSAGGHRP